MILLGIGLVLVVFLSNNWYYKYIRYQGPGQPRTLDLTGSRL